MDNNIRNRVRDRVIRVIEPMANKEPVEVSDRLWNLDIDSLDIGDIELELDEEFKVNSTFSFDLSECVTVKDIVNEVLQAVEDGNARV